VNDNPQAALKWALAALERRDLFSAEIEGQLRAKGFAEGAIVGAMSALRSVEFLNDERVQERLAEFKTRSKVVGREKARAALEARGIESSTAETLVDAFLSEEEERKRALAILEKRFKEKEKLDRAARYLASRGFSEETIEFAIEKHFQI